MLSTPSDSKGFSMERNHKATNETVLYGLIFLTALVVRLFLLGRVPLGEGEASWAFQAWQSSRGESAVLGSQVGYLAVTRSLFRFFGGSAFLARFWPALTGAFLIGIPAAFRKKLGLVPALAMAAGLALDPGLVAVSRIAGSPMPALVFLSLSLVYFHNYQLPWSIFFFGLGLFSGQAFWFGIFILGLSTLLVGWLGLIKPVQYFRDRIRSFKNHSGKDLSDLLLPILFLVLIGSSFLTEWQGLTAWVSGLPEFISSWFHPAGLSLGKLGIILLIGNPLALVFGLLGFIRAWRTEDQLGKYFSISWGAAILLLLIYPGRQASDVIWTSLPLWGAAAAGFVNIWKSSRSVWATYALAGLFSVMAALNWLTFIGTVFQFGNDRALLLQLGLLAASLALVILSMTVITGEWGAGTAWKGLTLGSGITLFLYMVSSLTLDAFLWEKDPRSLYAGSSGPGQMELLQDSISDASLTATGRPDSIQGAALVDRPDLRWYLKDFPGIKFADSMDNGNPPPLLITSEENQFLAGGENFRGQDFVISSHPGWTGLVPDDWISWIGFRLGSVQRDHIILWIRNDINSGY